MVGRDDLVGQTYLQAFPELVGTQFPAILDHVYRSGQPFVSGEMLTPLDRTGHGHVEDCYFTFNLEPLRSPDGEVYGMMAVAVDVTPQVEARKSLERGQAEREALLEALQAASRAKDEFLAMLGHELRNPLAPILTALELMRLRGATGAERERAIIERQVRHVVGLVDDLLDVSRITRGTLELKPRHVALAGLVAQAIEQASPLIEQRRHRLRLDVPDDLPVFGDPGRLSQVVANLLTNAAKYTEPGGDIEIAAGRHETGLWIRVRDTGIGIDPELLPHVFDAFTQAGQRIDRAQGGLGLGLTIVKSLVEAHAGSVTMHSEGPGRGTECTIRLPLAPADPPVSSLDPPPLPATTPVAGNCRVLLVDDNGDAADSLAAALAALGHQVEIAYDAPAALDLAGRFVPDVALLDVGLPVMDGYELAGRLRRQDGWGAVRFAALTGYGRPEDRSRTDAAHFDVHLVKPIDVAEVDATVRRLGQRAGADVRSS
jgi:signal transduction histidine kinase/ActR/RegA family two-component response regulator